MRRSYRRRAGAFDRFLSSQVDQGGKKVLKQRPLTKQEELRYAEEREQGALRSEAIRRERELVRQHQQQQQQRMKAELEAQYKRMVADAIDAGLLIED